MNALTILRLAAGVYVMAWLVGLFVAPARPSDEAAAAVKEYFSQHSGAAVTQSVLVHGVAGVALAAFAWSLSRRVDRSSGAVVTLVPLIVLVGAKEALPEISAPVNRDQGLSCSQ